MSQFVQRTRLETFRQSRVVVNVGVYSPVTGNSARLAVAGTGAGEGRALSGDALNLHGVDAPPDKGSRTSPSKYSAGATRVARLQLAFSSDVTTTDGEAMRAFLTGSSSFALTPLGVDAPPDKGVNAPMKKALMLPLTKVPVPHRANIPVVLQGWRG